MQLTSALLSANFGMSVPSVRIYELFNNIQSKDLTHGDHVITPYFTQLSIKAVCCNEEGSTVPSEIVSHLDVAGTVVLPSIDPAKPVHFTFNRSFRFDELVAQIDDHLSGKHLVKLSSQELAVYHVKVFAVHVQAYLLRLLINLGYDQITQSKAVASWLGTASTDKDLLEPHEVEVGNDIAYVTHEVSRFVYSQVLSQLIGMLTVEYAQDKRPNQLYVA